MEPALSRSLLEKSDHNRIKELSQNIRFDLPEKILQFGTGGFLRGFADYLFDKANKNQLFNGRVVVVKSTPGRAAHFAEQDNLYTINIKDKETDEYILSGSISRVLSASDQWENILEIARSRDLQLILSNTTEAGLHYEDEAITPGMAPASFPAKITAVLYERFKSFEGAPEAGLVILPCELVVKNGDVLLDMVLKLAGRNNLEPEFAQWVKRHNDFCNTIVDRIIPGKPDPVRQAETFKRLGYTDQLLIECESYLLWAIESNQKMNGGLEFTKVDDRVIITNDIEPYREQKLRLLNGTHTLFVPLAHLCGQETIYQSVNDPSLAAFMRGLMQEEIAPTLEGISPAPASYADEVYGRFQNPHIVHKLINIMFQQSTKMRLRNADTIQRYFKLHGKAPRHIALGFAAYLFVMRDVAGLSVTDDKAGWFQDLWANHSPDTVVTEAIRHLELTNDPDHERKLAEAVLPFLEQLLNTPGPKVLDSFLHTKTNRS